jgi:RAB protein geranylgeranyltransferase component A
MAMGNLIPTTKHAGITDVCKEQKMLSLWKKRKCRRFANKLKELAKDQKSDSKRGC